jgi:hypothetical protein
MFPYNLIGAITGRNHLDFLVKATGAQVAANLVVTDAHVIFDISYGRDYSNLRFHPKAYG